MNPSACILVIGNEILSGRTQDANIHFLATKLGVMGITLREVRVIPDDHGVIVTTINDVRARFDHVFTTGGIGPTHDDITSSCVADAVGVPWEIHPETFEMMEKRFPPGEFNAARQRMAKLPRGAVPIRNPISGAPGFSIANIHVMAGVPKIMQAMFLELAPSLRGGKPAISQTWHALGLYEGGLAAGLEEIQTRYPDVDLGSYPFHRPDGRQGVALVAKGLEPQHVADASDEVRALISSLGHTPIEGEPAP